jgi:GT2 family glycosyltransferase
MAPRSPRVSIIWLNYNSASTLTEIKDSLRGVADLNYDNFELIIVDNGSTDGSYQQIANYMVQFDIKARIVSTGKNLGFTGGNNYGYRYVSPDSKYVVLLNSDYVPSTNSLSDMIRHMEQDSSVGEGQLAELDWSGRRVVSAGDYLDELLFHQPRYAGYSPAEVTEAKITYASGVYCTIRRDAIKVLGRMFDENIFMYWEDVLLSLEVWNLGYKVKCFGEIGGRHYGSLTSRRQGQATRSYRTLGKAYFLGATNTRFKALVEADLLATASQFSMVHNDLACLRSFQRGFRLGEARQPRLDLYKAPIKKSSASDALECIVRNPLARPMSYLIFRNSTTIPGSPI